MKFGACIGFGEYEGKCENQANGERQNPNWCDRCDKLRHKHIKRQMEDIHSQKTIEEVKSIIELSNSATKAIVSSAPRTALTILKTLRNRLGMVIESLIKQSSEQPGSCEHEYVKGHRYCSWCGKFKP